MHLVSKGDCAIAFHFAFVELDHANFRCFHTIILALVPVDEGCNEVPKSCKALSPPRVTPVNGDDEVLLREAELISQNLLLITSLLF